MLINIFEGNQFTTFENLTNRERIKKLSGFLLLYEL